MHWLSQNINHFTAPVGILCGLIACILGVAVRRKRKAGETGPILKGNAWALSILGLLAGAILLGVAIGHNYS